jgi:ParB-like chromosome segregation protein Spo0J
MPKKKGRAEVERNANALERLEVVYVSHAELSPNAYNPNRQSEHDFDLLKKSMTEDGFTQPIIVRKSDMMIVDGEHRWRAGRDLGYDEVPVVFVDFTDEQMRISTLRHNRARGAEDVQLSAEVLRDLERLGALEWAQDSLMLDDTEIQVLLEDISAPEGLAGEEYNDGWEPASGEVEIGDSVGSRSDETKTVSMTQEAADRQREIEQRLRDARTSDEREMARRELDTHRIVAVFSGEQAETVKTALGTNQAQRILHLCTKAVEEGDLP